MLLQYTFQGNQKQYTLIVQSVQLSWVQMRVAIQVNNFLILSSFSMQLPAVLRIYVMYNS